MPFVFGISYEIFRLPLKFPDSKIVKALITPGLWMQKLTTMEPDESMLEVGIVSLLTVPGFPRAAEFPLPECAMSEDEYKAYLERKKEEPKSDDGENDDENNGENVEASGDADGQNGGDTAPQKVSLEKTSAGQSAKSAED